MAQVFYENGSCCSVNRNFDIVAIDLQRLREIHTVVCIAAGSKKVKALINAARGGFYNTLVVDAPTAEEMLKQLK
jgi:DNA-binding transcriptional regulator LsrR (DeoR family)